MLAFGCGHKSGSSSGGGGGGAAATPPGPAGAPLVSPLKYYNHWGFNQVYTIPVQVGGQTLETVLDTGSSNLLLLGDAAHCSGCVNSYGYDSTYAPTSTSQALPTGWRMNFAPIGQATVNGYADTVGFADQTFPDFQFGLVTAEQGIPNIWGIAYAQLAKPSGDPQTPLFDQLVSTGRFANQFSMRLCGTKAGSNVTLGGYDPDVSSQLASAQWTPITAKIWYSVDVKQVHLDTWAWQPTPTDLVIVDSGTNPIVLPVEQIAPLVQVLKAAAAKAGVTLGADFWPTTAGPGGYATLTDEQIAKFPPLLVDFPSADDPSKTFTLTVAPQTYFQTHEDGKRFLGIEPGSGSYILGTVFMENFVVLHARGDNSVQGDDPTARIGFLPNTGLCK